MEARYTNDDIQKIKRQFDCYRSAFVKTVSNDLLLKLKENLNTEQQMIGEMNSPDIKAYIDSDNRVVEMISNFISSVEPLMVSHSSTSDESPSDADKISIFAAEQEEFVKLLGCELGKQPFAPTLNTTIFRFLNNFAKEIEKNNENNTLLSLLKKPKFELLFLNEHKLYAAFKQDCANLISNLQQLDKSMSSIEKPKTPTTNNTRKPYDLIFQPTGIMLPVVRKDSEADESLRKAILIKYKKAWKRTSEHDGVAVTQILGGLGMSALDSVVKDQNPSNQGLFNIPIAAGKQYLGYQGGVKMFIENSLGNFEKSKSIANFMQLQLDFAEKFSGLLQATQAPILTSFLKMLREQMTFVTKLDGYKQGSRPYTRDHETCALYPNLITANDTESDLINKLLQDCRVLVKNYPEVAQVTRTLEF